MSRKRRRERQAVPRPEADPGPTLIVAPSGRADRDTATAPATLGASLPEQQSARDPAAAPSSDRALERGALVGSDYRIMDVLAVDDAAISYKAEDINLGVAVLLKEFAPSKFVVRRAGGALTVREDRSREDWEAARARFVREAQTLVRFRHPNIVRAHRALKANGTAYIVLDYDEGEILETWLSALGRTPTQKELDRLLVPLLGALDSVHAAGYVHGDLHPGSVLMRRSGGPLLVNFANCRQAGSDEDGAGSDADPAFAAPEMQDKDGPRCGPWSDIYSLAAVLHRAMMGTDRLDRADERASAATGDYRPEFLEAIDRALSVSADERPQSVADWEGLRPPDGPDPEPPAIPVSVPTLVRDRSEDVLEKAQTVSAVSGASTKVLSQLATQVLSVLPEIKEETDIPQYDFERWLLPAAFVTGFLGALLFATGSFPLAAVCQVAATVLFFLRGYMPLSRFLSHTTRRIDGIVRRVEQATRTAMWMIAAILVLLTVNPLFVERFVPPNSEAPLIILSMIIAVPALIMGLCGYFGTPVRRSIPAVAVGAANILVLAFSAFLLVAFVYMTLSTPENVAIHPAIRVNRYLYIIATLASGTLGILIFLGRLSAKQRVKQAALID